MSPAKILELRLKLCLACLLPFFICLTVNAQQSGSMSLLEFRYGVHFPLQDMKERFGVNNDFGAGFEVISMKSRFFAGADGMFIFGNNVREDVVSNLRSYDGTIIGLNGTLGDVNLKERGYYVGLNAGKIIPVTKEENNITGIRIQAGAGFMQHKIRVQDNSRSVVALESKEKRKGYDRLTNGPCVHVALGFQYQNPANNLHFHIMSDIYGARTSSRRDFDFQEGGFLEGKRTDILMGLNIGYIVSLSRSRSPDQIYY